MLTAQPLAEAANVDDSAVAMGAAQPAMTADDPAAAVITPPPVVVAEDDPAAAVITPPPVGVLADWPAEEVAEPAEPPSRRSSKRPEDISNAEDRPARFDPEADVRPGRHGRASPRRSRVVALVVLLLLGGGIAVWGARGGSLLTAMKDLVASGVALVATTSPPAQPPQPMKAAPVDAPAEVAGPATDVATAPEVAPPEPEPEPAAPAKMAKATVRESARPASLRSPVDRARHVLRSLPVVTLPPEIAPAPAAESAPTLATENPPASAAESPPLPAAESAPVPAAENTPVPAAEPVPPAESEASATNQAASKPEPATPARPNADDLVREAQQRQMRGHYAAAIGKAQAALEADPTTTQIARAYEIIGMSACAIGDTRTAREATSHLVEKKRELVRAACEKKGLSIE